MLRLPQALLSMLGQPEHANTEIELSFEQPLCNDCNHTRHSHTSPKVKDGVREEGYCVVCECEAYDGE